MAIYLIPFFICLAVAAIPFVIQLFVCMGTAKMWIRLIPVYLSAGLCILWAIALLQGVIPGASYIGNALDWVLWQSMCAALIVAHSIPFLIFGRK